MSADDYEAMAAAIVAPVIDANHPEHVHKCGTLYGDFECEESPCRCACGAVQEFGSFVFDGEPVPVAWRLPDGSEHRYPDPREREDAGV